MRTLATLWLSALLASAGCSAPDAVPGQEPPPGSADVQTACPGHFHLTLLVADGDEVLPYYDEEPGKDDRDASKPVEGIHMHADDGLIHIHPPVVTCYTLAAALFAVDVHVLPRGAVQADDDVRNGTVRLDVQLWGEPWKTVPLDFVQATVPDAARVLLMVNAPDDVSGLRAQVPAIPATYRPA